MSFRRCTTLRGVAAWSGAALLTLSACSGGDTGEPTADAAASAVTTTGEPVPDATIPPTTIAAAVSPTTTAPATTTRPSTTRPSGRDVTTTLPPVGSTTVFETSTTPAAPIAPPTDTDADEPVIELGTLSIPKLGVSMTMYDGIRMTTLDRGPGHWPGTALPGQDGNVVVGGHRTSSHRVFRDVDQLDPGDEIVFDDANGRHVYHVNRVEIVEPTAVWIVDPTETPTATLFACHPPGSTAQRIVVFADLVASA